MTLALHVRRRTGHRTKELALRVEVNGRSGTCRVAETYDLVVLEEVFVRRVYDRPLARDPAVIVDLGSNIGISVLYFKLRYPGCQVFGYEADRQTFRRLERNVAPMSGVTVRNLAVTPEGQPARLTRAPGSFRTRATATPSATGEVPGISMDALVAQVEADVDLMKVDIEGAEYEVMRTWHDRRPVRGIVGEFHPEKAGVSRDEFLALLPEYELAYRSDQDRNVVFWGPLRDGSRR